MSAPGAPTWRRLAYAAPAFVLALPIIPVYLHLPRLYGVSLGLGLTVTGLVLLGARLFDTVSDPLVGWLSDRLRWRGLRRKPWIAVGALIAGPAMMQLLLPPAGAGTLHLLIWSVLLYAGWTMVSVPYLAWGAEWATDYHGRATLTGWREGFGLAGLVAAGAVMAAAGDGAAPATGLHLLAWLALIGGAVTVPVLLVLVPEPPPPGGDHRAEGAGWRAILANKLFLRLLVAWFVNGIANGVPAALFLLYLRHGLEVTAAEEGMFILAYFAAGILAIPLWLGLARRLGKHRAWALAMALACAAFITVPFLEAREILWFLGVCMITGMALGADLALPPAIQGDVVDVDTWRHGQARAGTFFALWSMATKLALAVAVGVALPSLAALGFDAAAVDAEGRLVLVVIYAVPAVVLKGLAILLVWGFPLTGAKHAVVRRRLQRRAAANRYGMEAG